MCTNYTITNYSATVNDVETDSKWTNDKSDASSLSEENESPDIDEQNNTKTTLRNKVAENEYG